MREIDKMCSQNEQENSQSTTKERHHPDIVDIIIATGFGVGFCPWGAGTAGAALATAVWYLYAHLLDNHLYVVVITCLLIILGTLISIRPINRLEACWGADPGKVVVDEMVGVWITLLAVPFSMEWYYVVAAFLLFRFMDIVKPLGCRTIDRKIHGGWGVMFDDILAGIYGAAVLLAVVHFTSV
ncbi:MAG: phosphatidylglycerophosphatase A [Bacteroidaceae bacterium]